VEKPKFGLVLDNDGTQTPKAYGSLLAVVSREAMPPDSLPEFQAMVARYAPKAKLGLLTPPEELQWLVEHLDMFVRYGLDVRKAKDALIQVRHRPGLNEFLQRVKAVGIPVADVSYGCADFLEWQLLCNAASGLVDKVYAARLRLDAHGTVIGHEPSTYVLPSNKGLWSRLFALEHGIAPEHLIAVGDGPGDRHLGHARVNRFGLAKDEEERLELEPYFGEVVVAESFDPVFEWFERRTGIKL
jgi:hypothetical protein